MKSTAIRRRTLRQKQEGGFALLMIFLMASAVALMLYMQVPRQAFESERDKEQMLIDRGEQYKRAIYLYYVSNNRQWPSKMEDLENTNSHRYLRQRYIDPYTGKDEWRLIHTNGAYLTDSLVTPPPAQGTPGVQGGALAGTGAPTTQGFQSPGFTLAQPGQAQAQAAADPNAPPAVNDQVRRRASDNTMVSNASYQNIAGNAPSPNNNGGNNGTNGDSSYQPFNPATLPPISLYPNGYNAPAANVPGAVGGNGQPGQPTGQQGITPLGANQLGLNQQPGLNQPGLNQAGLNQGTGNTGFNSLGASPINLPGTSFPMTNPGLTAPNPSAASFSSATGGGFGSTQGQLTPVSSQNLGFNSGAAPGGAGLPPGVGPQGGSSQAMNLINQLLTQPRQAPAGIGPNQQPTTGGGGLAGVASTHKGTTIKAYADRTKYQEWEFVFQLNQQGSGIQLQPGQGPNGSGGIPTTGVLGAPGAPGAAPGGAGGIGAPGAAGGASPFGGATGAAPAAQPNPFFSSNQ